MGNETQVFAIAAEQPEKKPSIQAQLAQNMLHVLGSRTN